MLETWSLFTSDIQAIILGIDLKDLTRPIFFVLWLIIIFTPLTKVDRRDPIAAAVYVTFCLAAGVALVFAIPQNFITDESMYTLFTTVSIMTVISTLRWIYNPDARIATQDVIFNNSTAEGNHDGTE